LCKDFLREQRGAQEEIVDSNSQAIRVSSREATSEISRGQRPRLP